MSNNIDSLYDFIKQKSQEKGRPLKIVCDWDDTLMPLWPYIVWKASQVDCPFEWFFKAYFWGSSPLSEEQKKAVKKVEESSGVNVSDKLLVWQNDEDRAKIMVAYEKYQQNHGCKERFNAPFTTVTEDLLKALKEGGLIDDLLIITSYTYYKGMARPELMDNNGKLKKYFKTLGKFPESNFELTEINRDKEGKNRPERWERIKLLCPDFDMFIDDKKGIIKETVEAFADKKDKMYVMPDYQSNMELTGPNIFHLKIGISDIKDKDFDELAQKTYNKQSQLAKVSSFDADSALVSERERESIWKQPTLYWGLAGGAGVCLLALGIYWLIKKNKKPKQPKN